MVSIGNYDYFFLCFAIRSRYILPTDCELKFDAARWMHVGCGWVKRFQLVRGFLPYFGESGQLETRLIYRTYDTL